MKTTRTRNLFAAALALALLVPAGLFAQNEPNPTSGVKVPGPEPGTLMTKEYVEYVQAVGRMAYIWGWPLVNMGNRSIAFSKLPGPGLIGGVLPAAFNSVCMLTDYVSPDQRAVACPNQDVAYGFGVSQLDQGRWYCRSRILATVSGSLHSTTSARMSSRRSARPTAPSPAST